MDKDLLYEPFKLGNHTVPGIWRYMLPYELQVLRIPEERAATCDRCPRVHTDDYRPDYRCCTYHPRIPNFLLGLAAKHDPNMRDRLANFAKEGWLLPEGFQATPQVWAEFLTETGEDRFGKTDKVLCPFLIKENGFCSLYAFRNSVCSTFFCINDCGNRGAKFWDGLQDVVVQVEMALGQYSLESIGFDYNEYINKLNKYADHLEDVRNPKTKRWSDKALKNLWADRYGKEVETFLEIADLVDDQRDELWQIACEAPLQDAQEFERAGYELVAPEHRDELDEEDYDDDAVAASPSELWQELQRVYRKMWKLPEGRLQLNQKVQVLPNSKKDALGQSYADRSHEIRFLKRKNGKKAEWREFITAGEAEALQLFANPCMLSMSIANQVAPLCQRAAETFVAEWFGKKVLVQES